MVQMNAHSPSLYPDHQKLLPPGLTNDPVVVLPPEVSSQCIREALEFGRKDPAQILAFSTVSCKWQDLICSTPTLWGRIHIDRFMPDLLATIAAFAQLSAAVPIDLVFWTEPDEYWDPIASLLGPHAERIRSLVFRLPFNQHTPKDIDDTEVIFASISSIRNSLGSLPGLLLIDFEELGAIKFSRFKALSLPPDVRIYGRINVSSTLHPSEDNRHLTHVTSITTTNSLESFAAARGVLVWVSTIRFWDKRAANNDMDRQRAFDSSGIFTALRSLSYHQEYNDIFKSFLDQIGPQLVHLQLKLPVFGILAMVTRLAKLARLQDLELEITQWESTGKIYSVNCDTVLPGLRSFSLAPADPVPIQSIEPLHSNAFGTLFGAFIGMYPGVKQIHFNGLSDILRFAGTYIEGLTSLDTLSLYNIGPKPTSHSQICLPRLRKLVMNDFNSIMWVRIPDIRSLDFQPWRWWHRGPPLWNPPHNLRQLTIKSSHDRILLIMDGHLDLCEFDLWADALMQRWDLSRHHRLVCIRLCTTLLMNRHGNDLCEEIIHNPGSCPLLEEIVFGHFVDWDVLFIMLERRNIGNPDCKMIGKVTIPYVPLALRPSFYQLLQGIPAKRPSNIELSVEATRDAICDPTIPGCLLCLKFMVPGCKKKVGQFKPVYPLPFKDLFHINIRASSKLPPEVLSWMLRRQRLLEEWIASYSSFQSKFYRKECCYARMYDGETRIILHHQRGL